MTLLFCVILVVAISSMMMPMMEMVIKRAPSRVATVTARSG